VATITRTSDPVLVRFREALDEVYGARNIERVVRFGSRARGHARPDSDYDVAVFLNAPGDFGTISANWPV
jgi:predicted nucleotidyltransferase